MRTLAIRIVFFLVGLLVRLLGMRRVTATHWVSVTPYRSDPFTLDYAVTLVIQDKAYVYCQTGWVHEWHPTPSGTYLHLESRLLHNGRVKYRLRSSWERATIQVPEGDPEGIPGPPANGQPTESK